jgi:hypothetical protein
LATVVFVGLALFPPWIAVRGRKGEEYPARQVLLWHAPLWKPPQFNNWDVRPDYKRVLLEILAGEALVAAIYATYAR